MNGKRKESIIIETIGIPLMSDLSKEDFNVFVSTFEYEIREYYKNINNKKTKLDNNPP